jgi:hypothetical protein
MLPFRFEVPTAVKMSMPISRAAAPRGIVGRQLFGGFSPEDTGSVFRKVGIYLKVHMEHFRFSWWRVWRRQPSGILHRGFVEVNRRFTSARCLTHHLITETVRTSKRRSVLSWLHDAIFQKAVVFMSVWHYKPEDEQVYLATASPHDVITERSRYVNLKAKKKTFRTVNSLAHCIDREQRNDI